MAVKIACYWKTVPPKTVILAQRGSITVKRSIASPINGSKGSRHVQIFVDYKRFPSPMNEYVEHQTHS